MPLGGKGQIISIHELPRRGLLGNWVAAYGRSRRLSKRNGELRGGRPLGPFALAFLSQPAFVGCRGEHEGEGCVRNLGVPTAIVADEGCPGLAAQEF
jgi:hypothetical protein